MLFAALAALLFLPSLLIAQDLTPSINILNTTSESFSNTSDVGAAQDRILICNPPGIDKPWLSKVDCTNALMTMRQSEGIIDFIGNPYGYTKGRCTVAISIDHGTKERSSWLAVHMAATQLMVSCTDNNGVLFGGGIKTGPSGRIKIEVYRSVPRVTGDTE